jgi:uncharacterized protein YbaR (Trm112 family)
MRVDTLEVLRCPYCGGPLELVSSLFHERRDAELVNGILGCQCCIFALVDGIPVLHLQPNATAAIEHLKAGSPVRARRAMFGLEDEHQAGLFERAAASEAATYKETVEAIGPNFEGGYFLYRFSDPTFVVAQAVVRSVASTVLAGGRRAVDICGGSGHLTRTLLECSAAPPILADLYYAKIWLARRFTARGCEPVCCDGNAPMPFARGAFGFAMCTDAFMYIWTKRQFVGELERLIDDRSPGASPGAVLIGHTHNERTWSPSHGQPLSPEGYAALFETIEPRIFGESGLFEGLVTNNVLDLSVRDSKPTLDAEPALTIVATRHPGVFQRHQLTVATRASGEFRLNPLYVAEPNGGQIALRLAFPDVDYEQEYGACRRYLPDQLSIDAAALAALPARTIPPALTDLAHRRVILDLPKNYY